MNRFAAVFITLLALSMPVAFADDGFHEKNINAVKNLLKLQIKTSGVTAEQQTIIDFVLTTLENGPVKIKIETAGVKIEAKGTVNDRAIIDNAINSLGNVPGKVEVKVNGDNVKVEVKSESGKKDKDTDDDEDDDDGKGNGKNAADLIAKAEEAISKCKNGSAVLLKNAQKHLAAAKEALAEGKEGKAFGRANAAFQQVKHCTPKPTNQTNTTTPANGSISGIKFEDVNGIIMDSGELGLANWTITLTGPVNATTITNTNGGYSFANLTPGTYTVSEVLQSGWINTTSRSYTVSVNQTTANVNFGNFKLAGIRGIVFDDTNGNGLMDNEPVLAGQNVTLSKGGQVIASMQTDANGTYSFSALGPGTYMIHAEQQGWIATALPTAVTTASGVTSAAGNTGLFKLGVISGAVFNDTNNNSIMDADENGLAGWTIALNNATVMTDANGVYSFSNLTYGTYTVSEVVPENWALTTAGNYTITVTSGLVSSGNDFGNLLLSLSEGGQ